MKVILAPSALDSKAPRVELTLPYDDANSDEALDLMKRALVAYGFHWENIFGSNE